MAVADGADGTAYHGADADPRAAFSPTATCCE
jgi:hypothetical protein